MATIGGTEKQCKNVEPACATSPRTNENVSAGKMKPLASFDYMKIHTKNILEVINMKKVVIAAILMLALSPVTALAGDTVNVDMDVEIPQVVNIDWSVNGSSVQLVDANAITPAEFIAGEKGDIFGGAISCDSNEAWDITVEASNDTFDYTGSALPVPNKPTAWLRVDLDGAGTYDHQLNGTNAITIIDEQAPALAETHSILYKLGFTSNDKPGIYSTDLTYTIVID